MLPWFPSAFLCRIINSADAHLQVWRIKSLLCLWLLVCCWAHGFCFSSLCMPKGYGNSKCADAPLLIFQNPKSGPSCVGASNHQHLLMVCWNWKQLRWSTLIVASMMIVLKKFVKNMAPNGAVQHFWSNWKLKCNLQAEQENEWKLMHSKYLHRFELRSTRPKGGRCSNSAHVKIKTVH